MSDRLENLDFELLYNEFKQWLIGENLPSDKHIYHSFNEFYFIIDTQCNAQLRRNESYRIFTIFQKLGFIEYISEESFDNSYKLIK